MYFFFFSISLNNFSCLLFSSGVFRLCSSILFQYVCLFSDAIPFQSFKKFPVGEILAGGFFRFHLPSCNCLVSSVPSIYLSGIVFPLMGLLFLVVRCFCCPFRSRSVCEQLRVKLSVECYEQRSDIVHFSWLGLWFVWFAGS